MGLKRWERRFAASLLGLSAALYVTRWALFRGDGMVVGADPMLNEMLRYLLDDIAFVPISVLLVTLVIQRMLELRDRDALLHKLNMVVGAFFSEVGRPLMTLLRPFDASDPCLCEALLFRTGWKATEFAEARRGVESCEHAVDSRRADLAAAKEFLAGKRTFLLGLLQNPNLLEHESFTELLWAVLHLQEELDAREALTDLAGSDAAHLSGDIARAYRAVLLEWVSYMRHLSEQYPYLYSLAVRENPYDPEARVEVTG